MTETEVPYTVGEMAETAEKTPMLLNGDREKLADYIWSLAQLMGMHDWRIKLADDPPPAHPGGDMRPGGFCDVVYGRKYAVIQLAEEWATFEGWELREIICHELCHCHFAPVQWHVNDAAKCMTQREWEMFDSGFTDQMELHIDGISTAWARLLPLPIRDDVPAEEAA